MATSPSRTSSATSASATDRTRRARHRWELGGRSFVALGGAPSVNRHLLTEGVDWWPSEVIGEAHVQSTVAGGAADVMLTHDSPAQGDRGTVRVLDLDTLGDPR